MKEQVKALWKACFDESEEFTELYFRMRYKTEVNIAIRSGDEIISALQMLPYPMSFCGKTVPTSYVSGACTHPDFRNRGVMRELLSEAFARMLRKGSLFSTLIPAHPWLFDYYARMGYASVFKYSVRKIVLPEFIPCKEIAVSVVSEFLEEVYSYLNDRFAEHPCCIRHTADDFRVIMADLAVSGGHLFAARRESEIKGVAIIYQRDRYIVVDELFADDKDTEYSLLYAIRQHTGRRRIVRFVPPIDRQPQHPLGMARIIHAKKVLQIYAAAFPQDEMQIELTDKQLTANNGYYYLCKGKCMQCGERLPGAHLQLTVGELTNRLFQPLQPYMSLMLN